MANPKAEGKPTAEFAEGMYAGAAVLPEPNRYSEVATMTNKPIISSNGSQVWVEAPVWM